MSRTVTVLALPAGKSFKRVDIDPGSLPDAYALVNGGPLEAVCFTRSVVLWCNEEGKLTRLPPNLVMEGLAEDGFVTGTDVICGDVFFSGVDSDGDIAALTPEDEREIRDMLPDRNETDAD